jgi:VIT1/CCC1 family predicted Fe2+/Mn2+ transporter
MNRLLTTKKPSIEDHKLKPERSAGSSERLSLARLCIATLFGLLFAVAAVFTTMLPLSDGWRIFWLVICLCTFALALISIVLFQRGYKKE